MKQAVLRRDLDGFEAILFRADLHANHARRRFDTGATTRQVVRRAGTQAGNICQFSDKKCLREILDHQSKFKPNQTPNELILLVQRVVWVVAFEMPMHRREFAFRPEVRD